jgi:hypothetical protein
LLFVQFDQKEYMWIDPNMDLYTIVKQEKQENLNPKIFVLLHVLDIKLIEKNQYKWNKMNWWHDEDQKQHPYKYTYIYATYIYDRYQNKDKQNKYNKIII